MVLPGTIVEFNKTKQFKHVRPLGQGGTGDAHLFEDETTDMLFAFKKYSPKDTNYIEENYQRFVDEIKILFKISHPNIVRVYNYFLYPESKLGYLQMEYIDGSPINEYEPIPWNKDWPDIFAQTILAFEYLEANGILHRDIRPANIMIDSNDNVKIIDFGFGKKLEANEQDGKSVFLNWPVSQLPQETALEGTYNHKTEIYFVGKLFQNILGVDSASFKFAYIIDKMININPDERYNSFNEISQAISTGVLGEFEFSSVEKEKYTKFANALTSHVLKIINKYDPINDIDLTISKLASLIRTSSLETYIQHNGKLILCFLRGKIEYNARKDIELKTVVDFYKFLQSLSPYKQKIVLDNIYTRLSEIDVVNDNDNLPF